MNHEIMFNTPEKHYKINPKRFGAFVLAACVGIGGLAYEAKNVVQDRIETFNPTFSKETTEVAIPENGGIDDAVYQIEGVDSIDPRTARDYVESMPENTETLKDGLQNGESLTIPESVEKS